jgi:hypothetical protein
MKAIIGILIFAAACGAQQGTGTSLTICPAGQALASVKGEWKCQLVCGKYQHVDHWPSACGPAPCDEKTGVCTAICAPPPPDKCVDDLHVVTEREWQEIQADLQKLEALQQENAELTKCASCKKVLSRDCENCQRLWAS